MKTKSLNASLSDLPLTLTVEEAAAILRISRSTAYRLVTSGELESFRAGHNLRISKHSLLRHLGVKEAVKA